MYVFVLLVLFSFFSLRRRGYYGGGWTYGGGGGFGEGGGFGGFGERRREAAVEQEEDFKEAGK